MEIKQKSVASRRERINKFLQKRLNVADYLLFLEYQRDYLGSILEVTDNDVIELLEICRGGYEWK